MSTPSQAASVADLLAQLLSDVDGECLLVDPSETVLTTIGGFEQGSDQLTDVRVLATESVLKGIRDEFLAASALAEHVEAGDVELRVLPDGVDNTVMVTDEHLFAVVESPAEDRAVGLPAGDESFIADTAASYTEQFESADVFDLRTPARGRVIETLGEMVSEEVQADFAAVLETMDRVADDTVDEVTLSLLLAGRNRELLYDISKWGEDVGVASKASFSRMKTALEDDGFLDTEKQPVDIGRPRLRLLLDQEELAEADIEEFATVAEKAL